MQIISAICTVQILGQWNSSCLITSEEVKACYVSQTALWNLTKTTLVRVAFREIKADIMFFSLEPVTLRTWCLESNIYDLDITNSLFIFSLANLTCQISLLNFKGLVWAEQPCRSNEVVLEPFGAYISGLLIDGLPVGKVICDIVLHLFLLQTVCLSGSHWKPISQTNLK